MDEAVQANGHAALTKCVAELFNTVTADDILRQNTDGSWQFDGRTLTPPEVKALQGEAQSILQTRMWKVLERDMQYLANKTMYFNSKTEYDLIAGKLLLQMNKEKNERLKRMGSLNRMDE